MDKYTDCDVVTLDNGNDASAARFPTGSDKRTRQLLEESTQRALVDLF
jgi:hypothetical protein